MYRIHIQGWHPTRLNKLLSSSWHKRMRLKRADAETIGIYKLAAGVPDASTRRRVRVVLTLGKGQKQGDRDNWLKSLLDGLTAARCIVDDSDRWLALAALEFRRDREAATTIYLEDLEMKRSNRKGGSTNDV